jgi:TetR/AcrR family transcriptional regulator, regulator of biofilm formation and stress response
MYQYDYGVSTVTSLQPTQERSRVRRDALLRAALELISEGGTRAVTHRAVAARAGLPPAATTYYFASIQQLAEEALRLHVDERVEELRALSDAAAQGGRSVDEIARRFADSLSSRSREVIVAQYEVYLEAARNPALRDSVNEALDAFERLAVSALTALGARRPAEGAAAFVALIDGFALHRIARQRSPEFESTMLFEAMRALFVTQVMGEDELRSWHRSLGQPISD